MKISIITCVFNNSKYIKHSLKSFQSQNYKNKEHIIIDGGSTDGTVKKIKKYKNKNQLLFSSKDQGIYYASNKGIIQSSGKIIGILHSDDFYNYNNVISDVAKIFKDTNVDFVYGDLQYVSKEFPHKSIRKWKAGKFTEKNLYEGWMPPHPTVFIKKKLFKIIGYYNTKYKISSDYDFLIRTLSQKSIKKKYIKKTLVKMRIGGKSNRSIINIINKSFEDLKIIKKNKIGGFITLFYKNYSKLSQFLN